MSLSVQIVLNVDALDSLVYLIEGRSTFWFIPAGTELAGQVQKEKKKSSTFKVPCSNHQSN